MPKIFKVTYEPIDKEFRNGWRLLLSDGNIITEAFHTPEIEICVMQAEFYKSGLLGKLQQLLARLRRTWGNKRRSENFE
mgnify:FL=1